jgi:hypothetical protein
MKTGRQSKRFELPIPMKIRVVDSASPTAATATCSNVSSRGVYFSTDFPFLVGERVEVSLKMPKEVADPPERDWVCHGRVVRTDRGKDDGSLGVAVEFFYYEVTRSGSPDGPTDVHVW